MSGSRALTGRPRRAAWLSDELLLLVAERGAATADGAPTHPPAGGTFPARSFAGPDAPVLAVSVTPAQLAGATSRVCVELDGETLVLEASAVRDVSTGLRALLRERFARWDPQARSRLLAFLASLADDAATASLSDGLHLAREALRERLPLAVVHESAERAVHVDRIDRIDDRAFFLTGWAWDSAGPVTRITAVAPEGGRVELLERAFRHAAPDVAERYGVSADERRAWRAGFTCFFETSTPSRLPGGWVVEIENAAGRGVETIADLTSVASRDACEAIVAAVPEEADDRDRLLEDHVRPALTRLQAARRDRVAIAATDTYGDVPGGPEVSIVVPLYRRVDLLEHQLAQFAGDPSLRCCELLYVLDSPDEAEHLRHLACELFRLYGLPFRVLTLTENGGCALARARGASVASAPRLLFLDSDVIPARVGWLPALTAFHRATPAVGALAPKLLDPDGAIQHAGLAYEPSDTDRGWTRRHLHQGLHGAFPAANVARPVAAVTGSCMLVDASAYRESARMGWAYVQGGYEDSDLCLRLGDAGLDSWYLPQVALHHLAAQSYPTHERVAHERYNRWLHDRLCREWIEAAIARLGQERRDAA